MSQKLHSDPDIGHNGGQQASRTKALTLKQFKEEKIAGRIKQRLQCLKRAHFQHIPSPYFGTKNSQPLQFSSCNEYLVYFSRVFLVKMSLKKFQIVFKRRLEDMMCPLFYDYYMWSQDDCRVMVFHPEVMTYYNNLPHSVYHPASNTYQQIQEVYTRAFPVPLIPMQDDPQICVECFSPGSSSELIIKQKHSHFLYSLISFNYVTGRKRYIFRRIPMFNFSAIPLNNLLMVIQDWSGNRKQLPAYSLYSSKTLKQVMYTYFEEFPSKIIKIPFQHRNYKICARDRNIYHGMEFIVRFGYNNTTGFFYTNLLRRQFFNIKKMTATKSNNVTGVIRQEGDVKIREIRCLQDNWQGFTFVRTKYVSKEFYAVVGDKYRRLGGSSDTIHIDILDKKACPDKKQLIIEFSGLRSLVFYIDDFYAGNRETKKQEFFYKQGDKLLHRVQYRRVEVEGELFARRLQIHSSLNLRTGTMASIRIKSQFNNRFVDCEDVKRHEIPQMLNPNKYDPRYAFLFTRTLHTTEKTLRNAQNDFKSSLNFSTNSLGSPSSRRLDNLTEETLKPKETDFNILRYDMLTNKTVIVKKRPYRLRGKHSRGAIHTLDFTWKDNYFLYFKNCHLFIYDFELNQEKIIEIKDHSNYFTDFLGMAGDPFEARYSVFAKMQYDFEMGHYIEQLFVYDAERAKLIRLELPELKDKSLLHFEVFGEYLLIFNIEDESLTFFSVNDKDLVFKAAIPKFAKMWVKLKKLVCQASQRGYFYQHHRYISGFRVEYKDDDQAMQLENEVNTENDGGEDQNGFGSQKDSNHLDGGQNRRRAPPRRRIPNKVHMRGYMEIGQTQVMSETSVKPKIIFKLILENKGQNLPVRHSHLNTQPLSFETLKHQKPLVSANSQTKQRRDALFSSMRNISEPKQLAKSIPKRVSGHQNQISRGHLSNSVIAGSSSKLAHNFVKNLLNKQNQSPGQPIHPHSYPKSVHKSLNVYYRNRYNTNRQPVYRQFRSSKSHANKKKQRISALLYKDNHAKGDFPNWSLKDGKQTITLKERLVVVKKSEDRINSPLEQIHGAVPDEMVYRIVNDSCIDLDKNKIIERNFGQELQKVFKMLQRLDGGSLQNFLTLLISLGYENSELVMNQIKLGKIMEELKTSHPELYAYYVDQFQPETAPIFIYKRN